MYARYIPPPKGGQPPAPKPEVEASPSPAIASATAATPYARYVPPARVAPRVTPNFSSSSFSSSHNSNPAPRAPPTSKTHLNAAAIPAPESLAPKIVFNYDDDEDEPAPPKKRKIDSPEPTVEPEAKKSKKEKKVKSSDRKQKKEKKSKEKEEAVVEEELVDDSGHEKTEIRKKSSKGNFAFDFDDTVVEDENATTIAEALPKSKKKNKEEKALAEDSPAKAPANANPPSKEKKKNKRKDDDGNDGMSRHKGVLERAAKALKEGQKPKVEATEDVDEEDGAEPVKAHGLEPLPQPEPVAQDGSKPTYETLPPWIANPIRVTPETNASFTDLGVSAEHGFSKEVDQKLKLKGYKNAFAVQTAVIPLLLPDPDRQGDVVVSAATGSGKTLAYVLPMVRDISQGVVTRLRAVIVVPTRELVLQAEEVCEACASVFSGPKRKTVRIGISMGSKQFEQEQADLVEEDQRWDPEGHQRWLEGHFAQDKELSFFEDGVRKPLPNHVIDHVSKVDILICTPGRLVDHINRTPGFTLDYVRWLIVDEADKLLAQTFQEWLPVVMPLLSVSNKPDARAFADSNKTGVRKVVLSATMTRDLSLLNGLKLSRPKLVTLEGTREEDQVHEGKTEHVLPELLEESALKVRDPSLKPLYLVDLLNSSHISSVDDANEDLDMKDVEEDTASSSVSGTDSESSDSDTGSDDSDSESEGLNAVSKKTTAKPFTTTALIFTRSNEAAIRLSRLLSLQSPHLKPLIGTLTSTTRSSQRRKTLQAFVSRKLRILVASDLVARGIDLTNLDHVINYDMPTSIASYVHRVGRTARAGRTGKAWTLFTKTEAGWFWTAVAGKGESKSQGAAAAGQIKRKSKVGEIKINDRWDEERLAGFEAALEKLGSEASEMRKKKSK